jgi:mono/diheme cytochrome c family protein
MRTRESIAVSFVALILQGCSSPAEYEPSVANANPKAGRELIAAFECGACHVIPGVPGAWGRVGPELKSYKENVYVAGRYPNTPEVLIRFVRDAPSMSPNTAMPAIEMTDVQARDIAAYLYSL